MSGLQLSSTITLKSGTKLPSLGFGVWDSPSHKTVQSCLSALEAGYRHIDTAQVYGNETEVGEAVRKSGLDRKDVYLTSKILSPGDDAESTYRKALDSVKKVAGDDGYLDLLLIHNVSSGAAGVKLMWQAMERLFDEGKLKAIGMSNTGIGMLEAMKDYAKVWPPHVNQLELHPWCQQREVVQFCRKNDIAVEAYCPLVRNQKADDTDLKAIAEKHNKSTPQVLVRYCLQKNWVPLPKSDTPSRIKQNADIYDFNLSDEDMAALDKKDEGANGALVMVAENASVK
ncbi:Putative aldo/keto reductase, aldo-keto reductase, NADP-dependent oxidoreductase [Septoria linicola]|uniref:Aldo/keto reductase, aldo-keto reductase, NADP-dependent oxidoreductase n=1 Tax=Septoria linicola TaxID=215465 RepID=A0A9Q9EKT2_9PEZI|nr:putative aldo/keto reductase, aldo-keto reductase, NADP-dependent oxidoreductase [Septoria linicola]USW54375.1 Putative aldo/keto reductase, aldo-keto reductase, NADP-dependent oxidoreductase [Septoria linicola]